MLMIVVEGQEAKSRSCEFTLMKPVAFTDLYSSYGKARHLYGQIRNSLYALNCHM